MLGNQTAAALTDHATLGTGFDNSIAHTLGLAHLLISVPTCQPSPSRKQPPAT